MKKSLKIVTATLIAAGLLMFACAFAAAGFDIDRLSTVQSETNTYTVTESFSKIDIDTKSSNALFSQGTDVVLRASEDGKCTVVCAEKDKIRHSIRVEGSTLKIRVDDCRAWYDYITFSFHKSSVTVYLPASEYESLSVMTATGDIFIPSGLTFGSADVRTSTGDIRFNAAVKGSLNAKTSTGDIRLSGVSAKEIDLSVSTGDITMQDTVADTTLDILTSTGDVRFDNCDAAEITARTSTGDVTGTLRTPKIFTAKTSTGSVHVPETTTGGLCRITTSTGDINITILG